MHLSLLKQYQGAQKAALKSQKQEDKNRNPWPTNADLVSVVLHWPGRVCVELETPEYTFLLMTPTKSLIEELRTIADPARPARFSVQLIGNDDQTLCLKQIHPY